MNHFMFRRGELFCEDVPLTRIAAEIGTPAYIYSQATLERHFKAFDGAFADLPHLTCFSAKANSNLSLLRLFSRLGGGLDIVSGGELYRGLKAGVNPKKVVYSGVGKTIGEMRAALSAGILMFNVESSQELDVLASTAREMGLVAPIALRVNPDVDPKTHPYISTGLKKNKFGVAIEQAVVEYKRAAGLPGLEIVGLACHIGSQLTETGPFVDAASRLRNLIDRLAGEGINLKYLDLGGGLGITYDAEEPPHPEAYAAALKQALDGRHLTLILEPGRVIVGNAGVLLTQVLYIKSSQEKSFIVIDGAMNDLLRPTLYGSYHAIQPVKPQPGPQVKMDVVGPICESGDFLAKDRLFTTIEPGELLAVMSAGAYGFSMSSNYNSRPRPPEVLVSGDKYFIIRRRETYDDLLRGEDIPTFLQNGA